MADIVVKNSVVYAARFGLLIVEQLGFGVHGSVHVVKDKIKGGKSAIKAHRAVEAYLRELDAYERLEQAGVSEILGFHVPRLIRADDDLWVIEMTIVTRPFVLDFAGAYLDTRPAFSPEVWAEWEAEKREQFGPQWPQVETVMGALEELGIYWLDVSPSNIAFGA